MILSFDMDDYDLSFKFDPWPTVLDWEAMALDIKLSSRAWLSIACELNLSNAQRARRVRSCVQTERYHIDSHRLSCLITWPAQGKILTN